MPADPNSCTELRTACDQSDLVLQVGGMSVKLIGEANDYVGKGMAGGDIVIVPPEEQTLDVRHTLLFFICRPSPAAGCATTCQCRGHPAWPMAATYRSEHSGHACISCAINNSTVQHHCPR